MGALIAFNAVLECFVTALFVALMIFGMAKVGWLPILFVQQLEDEQEGVE